MPSSCGPNESVTPASNQQMSPALQPVSRMPALPRLAEDRVEPVHTPDREHVRRVASRHDHDVVRERELSQLVGRPRVELQRRQLRAAA